MILPHHISQIKNSMTSIAPYGGSFAPSLHLLDNLRTYHDRRSLEVIDASLCSVSLLCFIFYCLLILTHQLLGTLHSLYYFFSKQVEGLMYIGADSSTRLNVPQPFLFGKL